MYRGPGNRRRILTECPGQQVHDGGRRLRQRALYPRAGSGHPPARRALRPEALPGVRRQAAVRLPRGARAARLRPQRQDVPPGGAARTGADRPVHLRRGHREAQDARRLRHQLRHGRPAAD